MAGARTARHRKTHKLVQTWVTPGLHRALKWRANREGRTLANLVRRELEKLVGHAYPVDSQRGREKDR